MASHSQQSLALKYRPRTFADLVGQRAVHMFLERMVDQHKVPPAILMDGPRGVGKTTSARILAASLNCEGSPVPCGHCVSCKAVYDGTSMDVIEIDAASNGLVEDIRRLREQVLYDVGGNYRVILLDEAHACSTAAFQAMLKVFEEPPLNTVFVLLTTEPSRIPDTVLSRCMPFSFRRIGVTDIVGRLQHICDQEQVSVEPALLSTIAERADGGLRDAIMLLDQLLRVDITTLTGYLDLTGDTDYGPAIINALATNNIADAYDIAHDQLQRTGAASTIADTIATTLRDLLILGQDGAITAQGSALRNRQLLVNRLDPVLLVAAMKVLWDLKTRTRVTDDPRITLDLALAMLADVLTRAAKPPANATPGTESATTPGKLNLAQMRTMATS